MKFFSNSHKKGFTLIELLVVISIIALLSSVVLASVNSARDKARAAKIVQEVRQFQTAMEAYRTANGSYYGGGILPWHSTAAMEAFAAAMSPYININNLSWMSGATNFHMNYVRLGPQPSNCGGVIPGADGYDVIFHTLGVGPAIDIPSLKRWNRDGGVYHCFMNP